MKRSNTILSLKIIALVLMQFSLTLFAQVKPDTVMSAMIDELDRSMNELQYKDYDKPFYIRYGIDEVVSTSATASMGALINSSSLPVRNKFIRVMAGNYEFNDESLDSNINQTPSGANTWQVPLGDDYWGIRRSLWLSTDQVYRSASKIYAAHLRELETDGKTIEDKEHRRFSKVPIVNYQSPEGSWEVDREAIEQLAVRLSDHFTSYHELHNSSVSILNYDINSYFINSEGTKINKRSNIISLQLSATLLTEEGRPVFNRKVIMASELKDLPKDKEMKKEVADLIKKITLNLALEPFEESYDGPVLFLDESVPFLFGNNILNKFHASDIQAETSGFGVRFNDDPMDEKIGKTETSKKLNINFLPRLKTFNGLELLGTYDVDNEGVIPKDSIKIIENGVLRNVMTSRTLAKEFHKPTGTGYGPGVVSISIDESKSLEDLKSLLISKAKEEELEYGLIVKQFDMGGSMTCNIIKVNVEYGSEKIYRSARIANHNFKSLKKIISGSKELNVYNFPDGNSTRAISYIVPDAILFEDVEVERTFKSFNIELPLVERP